jgi:tetratricopeptide (TPR) repeat protein
LEKYALALNAATELGDQAGMAKSLHNIGAINQVSHKYAEALAKYEQSLKIKEELGDRAGLAKSLHQVGIIYQMIGDYAAALEKFGEALKIKEEIGDRAGMARSFQQIGNIYYLKHDYTAALEKYEQSLKIKKKLGDRLGIANSFGQMGLVFKVTGKEADAFKYLYHALAIFNQLQSPDAKSVLKNLGSLKMQKNRKSLMRLSTKRRRVMKGQSGGGRKISRSAIRSRGVA